jgi:hypothetical protein
LRESVTERLGLKVISLLLAVLLWLVVHTRRPADGDVAVGIAPLLDAPRRAHPSERGVVAPARAPAPDSAVARTP